jgi:hypothetical protein
VTARKKNFKPAGAAMTADKDEWFESRAVAELERKPTRAWDDMRALWLELGAAHPSTQKRIVARAFRLGRERGDVSPARLLAALDRILAARDPRTSQRRRDLCRDLRSCAEQGGPPPADLLRVLDRELAISLAPRARADSGRVREAACLFARGMSIGEIANALGCSKSTVQSLSKRAEFAKECLDETVRLRRHVLRLGQVLSDFCASAGPRSP